MKYKLLAQVKKNQQEGGDYWRDADFNAHLKLTPFQTTYQYLLKHFKAPVKVLEAGCGIGRWVIPLSQKGYNVTGIEIKEEAINIIRQNYLSERLTLVVGDIFNMPFPDNTFDIVISLGVLEHFESKTNLEMAIKEHRRVLKEDGVFIITVPHISLLRLFFHLPFVKLVSFVRYLKRKKEYFTEYRYSKRAIRKILEKNGYKVIDTLYDDLLPPYNFGLTVDFPINSLFRTNDDIQYKLNSTGITFFNFLWRIHPMLVSGGVGFICKKND
jgi:SAM-dependent methyltransferase